MSMRFSYCCRRASLTVVGAIVCLLGTSSPLPGSQTDGMLFMGASFGPTPEVAIQGAIEDAEVSASVYQLFTCQLVGEPSIFPGPSPEWGRNFSAQVTLACTP